MLPPALTFPCVPHPHFPSSTLPCAVQSLKEGEARGTCHQAAPAAALVLGPTRELTDQILKVAKSLSHHAKFRSAGLSGGERHCMGLGGSVAFRTVWGLKYSAVCCVIGGRWSLPGARLVVVSS